MRTRDADTVAVLSRLTQLAESMRSPPAADPPPAASSPVDRVSRLQAEVAALERQRRALEQALGGRPLTLSELTPGPVPGPAPAPAPAPAVVEPVVPVVVAAPAVAAPVVAEPTGAPPLLHLNVEISADESDEVTVYAHSDPGVLADAFCRKHGIADVETRETLRELIESSMAQVLGPPTEPALPREPEAADAWAPRPPRPVHERLYVAAQERQRHLERRKAEQARQQDASWMSMASAARNETSRRMVHHRASQYTNYGEFLYREGIRRKEEVEHQRLQDLLQREEREMDGVTFEPDISMTARNTVRAGDIVERLTAPRDDRLVRKLAAEAREAEMRECTFRPAISETSQRIAERRTDDAEASRHELLYREAKAREARWNEAKVKRSRELGSFQPNLVAKDRCTRIPDADRDAFFARLACGKEDYDVRLNEIRRRIYGDYSDPVTGRPLFQPAINTPKTPTRTGNVHERLYDSAVKSRQRHALLVDEDEAEIRRLASTPHMQRRSAKLAEAAERKLTRGIFDSLDKDLDGWVAPAVAAAEDLDGHEYGALLRPVLEQAGTNRLDFEAFHQLVCLHIA